MKKILMITSILLTLAKGIFAIEKSYADALNPLVFELLTNPSNPQIANMLAATQGEKKFAMSQSFVCISNQTVIANSYDNLDGMQSGVVAVTPLEGVVMKQDYCGSPGTRTLSDWMKRADANPAVKGHILYVNSPGGDVSGTMNFSEDIKSLSKPVVTYVDENMASAAYWIGSSGKYIMASNKLNQIGSIGTYATLLDDTGFMESKGIKKIHVYATKSTHKNEDTREALLGNEAPLKARIDVFNEAFLQSVIRNRFTRKLNEDETLNGQLLFTDEAIKYGLIDGVGTFNDAVKMVDKLARKA